MDVKYIKNYQLRFNRSPHIFLTSAEIENVPVTLLDEHLFDVKCQNVGLE